MGFIDDTAAKFIAWSKTFWAGLLAFLLSVAVLVIDFWDLLDPEAQGYLREFLGPEAFALFGLLVIVLRTVTKSPVRWR
jgi:hypothetical protein